MILNRWGQADRFDQLDGEFCVGSLVPSMPASVELAFLEDYLAKNLFSWIRADYRTEAAGKVTQFNDKVVLPSDYLPGEIAPNARSVDPAHALAQASGPSQVAAVSLFTALSNKEGGQFAGAQFYSSTIAAANWQFFHDGSGAEWWFVFVPGTSAGQVIVNTTNTGETPGCSMVITSGGKFNFDVWRTGGAAGNVSAVGTVVEGVATFANNSVISGANGMIARQIATQLAATTLSSPTASPGAQTLTLGKQASGGGFFDGVFAEVAIASRVDAQLRASVNRYIQLYYGLS